jgi:hypothetical protein
VRVAVSEETKQLVRAYKEYMYEYYVGWFKYINQRKVRERVLLIFLVDPVAFVLVVVRGKRRTLSFSPVGGCGSCFSFLFLIFFRLS